MKELEQNLGDELFNWQQRLFRRSLRRRRRFERIAKALGIVTNQQCLEISSGDMMLSCQLRNLGGEWASCGITERAAEGLSHAAGAAVGVWDATALPFEDGRFDAVTVVDAIECVEEDYAFIRECHRVLKSDGRLIVHAWRYRSWSFMRFWNHWFGERDIRRHRVRPGYADSQLFDILKDGFDVPGTERFSGFFTGLIGAIGAALARLLAGPYYESPSAEAGEEDFYRYQKLHALGAPGFTLLWLAEKLDQLFFMLPRYELIARTKRRVWRPRRIPVLRDGRSIAEAAINTKIGTAAPF